MLPMRLTSAKVTTALARLIGDPSYRVAAERVGRSASHLGPNYAAGMVETFLDAAGRSDSADPSVAGHTGAAGGRIRSRTAA
jgi:UDP:flavonoid glycosyltransferase YjiC (YdhE family)